MGGFILSIDETPQIRKTFAAFDQAPLTLNSSIGSGAATRAHELIMTPPGSALMAEAEAAFKLCGSSIGWQHIRSAYSVDLHQGWPNAEIPK